MTKTVKLIHSYEAIMPSLIQSAANGSEDAKEALMQMARALDVLGRKVEAE